jgi:hypothetical protein
LSEQELRGEGRTPEVEEVVVVQPLDGLKLAADVELLGGVEEVLDAGVGVVVAAEDLNGLSDPAPTVSMLSGPSLVEGRLLVGPVNVLDGQDGEGAVVTEIAQGDTSTGLDAEVVDGLLGHVQVDGHAEEVAVNETVVLDDAIVVGLVQEAWRRSC